MKMGERLAKKINPDARESISFSTTTTSTVEDVILTDNQKLWEYIRQKRNCNTKVDLNLMEILEGGLRTDFDIHIEKRKPSGNFQQKDNEIEIIKKKDNEKNDEMKNELSKINKSKYSPGRKKSLAIQNSKTKNSPSKRNNSSIFRRNTRGLGKRVLLKEFEKTVVPEKQFNPCFMSTPIGNNIDRGNVFDNNNLTLSESSSSINKNDVELDLLKDKEQNSLDHGNNNFNKNKTIASENSMEISLCYPNEKNKEPIDNSLKNCSIRITRLHKRKMKNTKLVECEHNFNESKTKSKNSAKINENNNSFTVIASTQEGIEKDNENSNNESILIPETQEQQLKENTLIYDKEISVSELFADNIKDEGIEIKNEKYVEDNDILIVSNNETLCVTSNMPNEDKRKEDSYQKNSIIVDAVEEHFDERIVNDTIVDNWDEIIDCIELSENQIISPNKKVSPKRHTFTNENGASPPKQRRTYTISRKSSITDSSKANNQIENENQNKGICHNNDFAIGENTESNRETPITHEQQWIVTKVLNSPRFSYDISKSNTNPTSTKKTTWISKIPQIKRTGNLASLKPITPFKIREESDKTKLSLPVIVSVQSLGPKTSFNNASNLNEKNNMNENFNRNALSSRLDKIIDAVQNSTVPKSPLVIMIDNNRNKNNENNSTTSQCNDIIRGNSTLPMPPPEFSDSYQSKSKNISTSLKRTNVSSKIDRRNRTNYDNINMLLISEDESDEVVEKADHNAEITDDSILSENNMIEVEKDIFKKPTVNLKQQKSITKTNIKTLANSKVMDYSLKAEKFKSLNTTPNNNSKIFLAENFSVQPVDLRKKKSRRSSVLAQFKINAINEIKSLRKNISEEDFNKILEEYKIRYENKCSETRKSIFTLDPQDNKHNPQKNIDIPLVNLFRENEYNQSFTEVLKKNDRRNRESRNSMSDLPAPPSFLLHSDVNQTEEFMDKNPECSIFRLREQNSRENSIFPNPPSFVLADQIDLTLPINKSSNVIHPKPIINSNKRLSRYYQFKVQNEKNTNKKRSVSTTVTLNSNKQKQCSGVELQSKPVEFSNAFNSESNNIEEFPLPPAEAYDRPNEIVIDIPQNRESSSGYLSAYFPANKRKKSIKNRFNAEGRSSSSDSPEPKKVFRKQYRNIKKSQSMPSLKQKLSDEFQQISERNSGGDKSFSSTSTLATKVFVDIRNQINEDTDHVYDEPEVVAHIWKESIRKKSVEEKEKKIKKNKRGRQKIQSDPLKETYLNITKNLPPNNLTQSFNKTNDGHRRKLYEKGKSDTENSILENQNQNTFENLKTRSFSNDNLDCINQNVTINKLNSTQKKSSIFNNVNQSTNIINSNYDDAVFKKPILPAPKSNKKTLTKNKKNDNSHTSNKEINKDNESNNNQNIIRNTRNSTKNFKSEAQKLLENLPRSYRIPLNNHENDESTVSSSTIRRSGRKPAPRRIYKYYKYSTNEYEVLPSMTEYNKIMKDFYNKPKINKKKQKKTEKQYENEEIFETKLPNKNKLNDNQIDNKKKKTERSKQKKNINEIIEDKQDNDLNNRNKISLDFVEGVEIQNTSHFVEKQNKNADKTKSKQPKNKNNSISLMNELHNISNDCSVISKTKDISQLVDTLKLSFNKFETTVLANLGSSKNDSNVQKKNLSNVQNENENENTAKNLRNNKSKEKFKSKKSLKSKKNKTILKENTSKQNDINENSRKITENDDNLNNFSEQTTKTSSNECYDLFHWVKQLASASTKINNYNSKNNSKNDDDIQRYFAENSFRITDISKMQISEKNGVQYAFYKEERSKDFGYIKFKPGSQKPKIRSKTFDLYFLFMFGILEFHIDGEAYNSKAGNFVSIPKGTYYSIVNNSSDAACLFFIKVCNNTSNSNNVS